MDRVFVLSCLFNLFPSASVSSALWLLLATFCKLPISGTHSIVGATVGFSLVCRGTQGLRWTTLGMIGNHCYKYVPLIYYFESDFWFFMNFSAVASWFISPVLSGMVSVAFYKVIDIFILQASQPFKPALKAMPLFYGFTVIVNVFSIVHNGPRCKCKCFVIKWKLNIHLINFSETFNYYALYFCCSVSLW